MCRPIKFSKLVRLINIANSPTEKDKHSKLIEIINSTCHERLGNNKFRVKTINDLLKKQNLRSSAFVMYVDIQYNPEIDLIILDYPFYPKKYP